MKGPDNNVTVVPTNNPSTDVPDDGMEAIRAHARLVQQRRDTPAADYEASLFQDGTLDATPQQVIEEGLEFHRWNEKLNTPHDQNMDSNLPVKSGSSAEGLAAQYIEPITDNERQRVLHQIAWVNRFRGLVPKSWSDWWNVETDISIACERGIQLSPELVTAAIAHRQDDIVAKTARGQQLSVDQLAWALFQLPSVIYDPQEIIGIQAGKGMSADDIEKAREMAEDLKNQFKTKPEIGGMINNLALPTPAQNP